MGNTFDIGSGVGAVIGALGIGNNKQDRRQVEQAGKLARIQVAGGKEMSEFQKQQDLQFWKDTNYPAQMEMMKQAGLNPALMYGSAGSGGQTGSGGGGMPSTGSAADAASTQSANMGMGMQMAQLSMMKAQTMWNERKISDATYQDEIKRIRNEAIGSGIDNEVKRLGMNLDRRKVNAIEQAVQQGWDRLILEKREVTVKELAQAAQESYMRNSHQMRQQELNQREWEAIGDFAIGAAGGVTGAIPKTSRTSSQHIDGQGNHSVTNSRTTTGY